MTRARAAREPDWAHARTADLLQLRLCDLGIEGPGPWLSSCLDQLEDELAQRGLRPRPRIWVSDEWFSPDGVAGLAVPFYLAHPRLRRLEQQMMHGVEGGSRAESMRLLRHEAAHALQHAHRFERRAEWRHLFGRSSTPYPDRYRPDPTSRSYVHHLRDWYAQCHPDEDFAETFAVWLAPGHRWRRRYEGWPVLDKLDYVDRLMAEVAERPAPRASRRRVDPISQLSQTLGDHYRARRARFDLDRTTWLDQPLAQLLGHHRGQGGSNRGARRGAAILRQQRGAIRDRVDAPTPERAYAFGALFADCLARSRILDLRARRAEADIVRDAARLIRDRIDTLFEDVSAWEWIPV